MWCRAGCGASAPQLCSLPRYLLYPTWRGKDLSVPQGRAAEPLSLDMPFIWTCVHFAVQGILPNHGEFSSKALVIFICLGNDAFTHTHSFWQGFTAEQLPGLEKSWKESSGCAQAEAKLVAFIGKPRDSRYEGKKQAAGEGSVLWGFPSAIPSSPGPAGWG